MNLLKYFFSSNELPEKLITPLKKKEEDKIINFMDIKRILNESSDLKNKTKKYESIFNNITDDLIKILSSLIISKENNIIKFNDKFFAKLVDELFKDCETNKEYEYLYMLMTEEFYSNFERNRGGYLPN